MIPRPLETLKTYIILCVVLTNHHIIADKLFNLIGAFNY